MKDIVRVFNQDRKMTYEEEFKNADKAYEFYKDTVGVLKRTLPAGRTSIVIRYSDGDIMAVETVVGTK